MLAGKYNRTLSILMGVIILLADLYWMSLAYGGYSINLPLELGIIILVADLIWLALEF